MITQSGARFVRSVLPPAALFAALVFLTACASHPKPPPPAARAPEAAQLPASRPAAPTEGEVSRGPAPGSEQDFVINIGDRVYFDYDKAEIRSDAQPVLASQAKWLQTYPDVQVRIEGNCDERGTREYNFALGARRADAVKTFLVDHGINAARVTTISYGKEKPLDLGHDDAAWAKDRNGHTAIVSGALG
jgi:peptidoglycan-associated lipoprotein